MLFVVLDRIEVHDISLTSLAAFDRYRSNCEVAGLVVLYTVHLSVLRLDRLPQCPMLVRYQCTCSFLVSRLAGPYVTSHYTHHSMRSPILPLSSPVQYVPASCPSHDPLQCCRQFNNDVEIVFSTCLVPFATRRETWTTAGG